MASFTVAAVQKGHWHAQPGLGGDCWARPPLDSWMHLAIVRDGTGRVQLFLNGKPQCDGSKTATRTATLALTDKPLYIGSSGACPHCGTDFGSSMLVNQVRLTLAARYAVDKQFTAPAFIGPDATTAHYVNSFNRGDSGVEVTGACLQPDKVLPVTW